ncbi:MAG TPA: multidrug efflux MFS transporter [Candidatus Corynebacterium avicola]|uniref:Multidrug efflux MFS transporter n=1 Tax=Candidatus Corynebacterium avicola TaxID=2838527 RepID=A0A9D1ULD2_9CORY|nr:multidrug efflux MFS transporter [Candidatus Corynebacterium avicola]
MSAPTSEAGLPPGTGKVVAALVFGALTPLLDSTIVTVALHDLSTALGTGASTIQWVTTAYILMMGAAVPVTGWAQARFGARRVWIVSLLLFVAGSVLCAFAPEVGTLIAARVVQGAGAGMIMPLMQSMALQFVGTDVPQALMGKLIATISLPMALGPILGPVIGGVILHWLDWRWIFLVNVPLIAVALVLALLWIPAELTSGATGGTGADGATGKATKPRLDVLGLVLLVPGLVGILLGLSQISSTGGVGHLSVILPLIAGLLLTTVFVVRALRSTSSSLVDLRLLRYRPLATASVLMTANGALLYSAMFLLPLFFQQVRGTGVLAAAFLMVPQGVGALVSRALATRGAARIGAANTAAIAFGITALATVPLALADASTSSWWLGVVLFIRGCGVGALMVAPMMVAYRGLKPTEVPHATVITRTLQQIGSSFGVAVTAVVMEWTAEHSGSDATDSVLTGFHVAFWCVAALSLAALPVTRILPDVRDSAVRAARGRSAQDEGLEVDDRG